MMKSVTAPTCGPECLPTQALVLVQAWVLAHSGTQVDLEDLDLEAPVLREACGEVPLKMTGTVAAPTGVSLAATPAAETRAWAAWTAWATLAT